MPYLIAQVDDEEQAALLAAGYEVLAEGTFQAVRDFLVETPSQAEEAKKEDHYLVLWLDDGPLETLGLDRRNPPAS